MTYNEWEKFFSRSTPFYYLCPLPHFNVACCYQNANEFVATFATRVASRKLTFIRRSYVRFLLRVFSFFFLRMTRGNIKIKSSADHVKRK